MELFMKYPQEVQNELLSELLSKAQNTETGIRYDFRNIENYEAFRANVPLSTYESMASQIDRCRKGIQNIFWPSPIKWFAKSSGTTNAKSKFIPVSTEALEDCHYKAGKDMLSLYFNNNPDSKLLSGKCLRLGGSHELYSENNSYFGDLSAIIIQNMPFWAELSSTPSHKTSLMSKWETKMQAIVQETLTENVTSLAGVPSWMLLLLQKVLKETGNKHITEVWPDIEVYFHGGVSFKPYSDLYKSLFPNKGFKFYEIYNASEGFFGIQDRNNADDLLLMLDYGIFYEFIPFELNSKERELKAIPLAEVALNTNYELVITTNAGLWRYRIGDTLRFTNLSPYRIQITGRKHPDQKFIEVDTSNILFIAGGAFDGIERHINKRLNLQAIGYKTTVEQNQVDKENMLQYITPRDVRSFGLIPEIIGRLPVLTFMKPLDKETLLEILTAPKNALIKQYIHLFDMDDIKLQFTSGALHYIVEKSIEYKLGARGLRSLCEAVLNDAMFELPNSETKSTLGNYL